MCKLLHYWATVNVKFMSSCPKVGANAFLSVVALWLTSQIILIQHYSKYRSDFTGSVLWFLWYVHVMKVTLWQNAARMSTHWLSTWLAHCCSPFLKHDQTFCFLLSLLFFLITSFLSKQKAILLSAVSHLCRSVSQFQIINWSLGQKKCPRAAVNNHNVTHLAHYPL